MFKRIIYDTWTAGIPVVAFCLTFGVFLFIALRSLCFKKPFVKKMSLMPLESDQASVSAKIKHNDE